MNPSPRIHLIAAGDEIRSVGTRSFLRPFLTELERQGLDVHVHFFQFRHLGTSRQGQDRDHVPDFPWPVDCPASARAFRILPITCFRLLERIHLVRFVLRTLTSVHPGEPVILHGVLGAVHLFDDRLRSCPLWWLKLGIIEEEPQRGIRFWARKRIENLHAKRFGRRIVVSSQLAEYLAEQYGPPPRGTFVLPCLVDAARFHGAVAQREATRRRLGFTERTVFLYSGINAPWQCIPETVAFFAQLRRRIPGALLWVLTPEPGAMKPYLSSLPPGDVRLKSMPHEKLGASVGAADFGLLLRKRCLVNRVASPVKFPEYLASGVPVIIGPEVGDYSERVRTERLGVVVDPAETAEWDRAIGEIAAALATIDGYRGRCLEAAKSLSWQAHRRRLSLEFFSPRCGARADGDKRDGP